MTRVNPRILVLLLAAAGCAAGGEAAPPRSGEPAPAAGAGAREPEAATDRAAAALGMLTLESAREQAAAHRRELVAARAELSAAIARAEGAGRFPDPVLVARVESAPLDGRTVDNAELVAGISQALPLSDRRGAERSVEAAGVARERARLEVESARVAAEVHGAFATALFAQEAERLRRRFADEGAALAAAVRARAAAGDAPADEEARAALDAARAGQELLAATRLRDAALRALAAAIGLPDAALDGVAGALGPTLALPDLAALSARLADHPALRAADADVALARAALELAREQRIPDVNLDLFYRQLGNADTPAFDVGISLPLRLFQSQAPRTREAQAQVDAAAARASARRVDLAGALRGAHARLASALEMQRFLREEVLPRHAELVRIEEARVRAGDATAAALGAVRRERLAGEIAALDAMREALASWAELDALVPGAGGVTRG